VQSSSALRRWPNALSHICATPRQQPLWQICARHGDEMAATPDHDPEKATSHLVRVV
jgi:hypothetical protein